jgi:hypothetical protein
MINCLNCNTLTSNPKFCTLKCAASYNNKISPKRIANLKHCKNCGRDFHNSHSITLCCSPECATKLRWKEHCEKIEKQGYFYPINHNKLVNSKSVRKYLIEKYGNKCFLCNLNASDWHGSPLVLIVDHINGHANDWGISNIRLVCPNCDTQLPTFKARNKGNCTRKYTITQR